MRIEWGELVLICLQANEKGKREACPSLYPIMKDDAHRLFTLLLTRQLKLEHFINKNALKKSPSYPNGVVGYPNKILTLLLK